MTVSRSGQILRPCSTKSSPTLPIAVTVDGAVTANNPRRNRAAPTPPARTATFRSVYVVAKTADGTLLPVTAADLDAEHLPPEPVSGVAEVSRRPGVLRRLRHIWQYRELLGNLVRKELKVKYKNSVLGFLWSLLNPLLYLVIFSIVFQEILRTQVPYFAIFLLSGLVVFNFFSNSVNAGTTSIVSNAPLVQKVWFPREILPVAGVGAAFVHFCLQLLVLLGALLAFTRAPDWRFASAIIPALIAVALFSTALAIIVAAANVYLRDTQHLVELVLLAWFWMSAVVYPYNQVAERLGRYDWVPLLNPVIPIVLAFQRVLYNPDPADGILPVEPLSWYLRNLGIVCVASFGLLLFALWMFGRLEDNFAEEI